jgi:hypothetical protein
MPSIVTHTTLSPSISGPPLTICTPILIVICCPNLTIFVLTPIPANGRFVSACAHEALGGQSDGADTVEEACELLEGGECHGEEVDAAVWCSVA